MDQQAKDQRAQDVIIERGYNEMMKILMVLTQFDYRPESRVVRSRSESGLTPTERWLADVMAIAFSRSND